MKKQSKENEEIVKIIVKHILKQEREQVISYKKKPISKGPKESDDEIQSANSLKSGVFSQDSDAKFNKKNTPLPELYREKKRIFYKGIPYGQPKQVNNYLEKEVRQHDNLVLKQKNNHLTNENMKLKTKIMNLEKQLSKYIKTGEEQGQKPKPAGIILTHTSKLKGTELLSLKMTIKNLRKELDEQKKQNQKIKFSVKFTRINELQCQREEMLAETARLRLMLEEQYSRRASQKVKEHGLTGIQQKYQALSDKNAALMKQNAQLKSKLKGTDEVSKRIKQVSQNQKNLSKMLFNAKRLIKEKEKQIENLKVQTSSTQAKIQTSASINMNPKSEKEVGKVYEHSRNKSNEKRIMSKSAQKYRKKPSQDTLEAAQCKNCAKYKQKIVLLEKKIQQLAQSLKKEKQNNMKIGSLGQFSREQIQIASNDEVEKLVRFLVFRFKAHHLSYDESQKYLINGEVTEQTKKQLISAMEMAQSLIAEPFSVLTSRYLQVCLLKLFYPQQCEKNAKNKTKLKIDENKKLTKGEILNNFSKIIKPYEVMAQQKQQEMFIQIAELVTNYHQHILTALNRKRNGEGTISQQQLTNFFNEIQLEKQFVDFIICQIILESLDLEHLNFYTMFEIFYMPAQTQNIGPPQPNQPNKKKFQVDHCQIVKQQDQQYQQSKSHLDMKQKSQSKHDQLDEYEQEQQIHSPTQHSQKPNEKIEQQNVKNQARQKRNKSMQSVQAKLQKQKLKQKSESKHTQQNYKQEQYEQLFEEQKMNKLPEQEKANQENQVEEEELKPYAMEEIEDQYKDEFNQQ